jgi:hypothetical protein
MFVRIETDQEQRNDKSGAEKKPRRDEHRGGTRPNVPDVEPIMSRP